MATSVLEELVTVLGYEIDDGDLKKYQKTITAAKSGMKAFAVAATAVGAAMAAITQKAASSNDELFLFSKRVGESFEDVQRFVHATKAMGGSVDDATGSLAALNQLASSAALGQGGGELFGFLGITPTQGGRIKSSLDLFKEIAEALKDIPDEARRADLAGRFGISPRQIMLLDQGAEGIERIMQEMDRFGFVLSEKQGRDARGFMRTLNELETVVRGLGSQIALRLAPRVTDMIDSFIEWAEASKGVVDQNFDEWIINLEKLAGPAKVVAMILAAMFIGANLANIAIAALVLTFAGLVDDIAKFRKGHPSLVGKGLETLKETVDSNPTTKKANEVLHGLVAAIDDQVFGGLFDDVGAWLLGDSKFGQQAQERRAAGNVTNDINININGATGPGTTARAIIEALREYMREQHQAVTVSPES